MVSLCLFVFLPLFAVWRSAFLAPFAPILTNPASRAELAVTPIDVGRFLWDRVRFRVMLAVAPSLILPIAVFVITLPWWLSGATTGVEDSQVWSSWVWTLGGVSLLLATFIAPAAVFLAILARGLAESCLAQEAAGGWRECFVAGIAEFLAAIALLVLNALSVFAITLLVTPSVRSVVGSILIGTGGVFLPLLATWLAIRFLRVSWSRFVAVYLLMERPAPTGPLLTPIAPASRAPHDPAP